MPKEFKLPELGEDTDSGQVTKVLVSEGDAIEEDQGVIELETGKATVEVPSTVAGKVLKVQVSEGDEVKVGQTLLTVEDQGGGEEGGEKEEEPEEEPEGKPEKKPEEKPEEKPEGKPEKKPEEKPKEKPEEKAEGKEAKEEGEEEKPGPEASEETPKEAGRKREGRDGAEEAEEEGASAPAPQAEEKPAAARVPAAPSVRRFAREIGVDLAKVSGSGPQGRVSREDVKSYAKKRGEAAEPGTGAEGVSLPDFGKWGETRREPMNNIRRMTAEHLAMSWRLIPHVTQHDRADITELEAARKKYGDKVDAAGGKLTVTAVAVKVAALALRRFPRFNASVDVEAGEMIYKDYCHIGVAVDTERGLLVPVVRDADKKTILEIAVEVVELARKAREGKLKPDDLAAATFTITNVGGIGGEHFTPIISFPQVAVLGLGRASRWPVFCDDAFSPRLLLPLSLSYDHRALDGADGARFLRWTAESFENPLHALLGL